MKRLGMLIVLAIMASLAFTGCNHGGLSEGELKTILPTNITTCYFNDRLINQSVEGIDIIKSDVSDDAQTIQCEITLKDPSIERRVFAVLNVKKYEVGGWQIDSWYPYEKDHVIQVEDPNSAILDEFVNEMGYANITEVDSRIDNAEFVTYKKTYSVEEPHTYATLSGAVTCSLELTEYSESDETPARFSWEGQFSRAPQADFSGLSCSWNIPTQLSGVETNPNDSLPHKFDASLDPLVDGESSTGSGTYLFPAYDGFQPKGEYGSYDFVNARYKTEGSSPSDATATLCLNYEYGPSVVLSFTPDQVTISQDNINGTINFELDGVQVVQTSSADAAQSTQSTASSAEEFSSANTPAPSETPTTQQQASALVVSPSQTGESGYILPEAATYLYTREELAGLSAWDLCLARNEIPARHGLIFETKEIGDYFSSKSWYNGTLTRKEFRSIVGIENTTEEANVETILRMEEEMNSPYLPQ